MSATDEYWNNGFAFLDGFLPPEVAAAYLSIMQRAVGNTHAEQKRFHQQAHAVSNPSLELFSERFPFSLGMGWGLTPAMEAITGKRLLPSYVYGRIYPKGVTLHVHNDRPSNEHSLNLTLGLSDDIIWDFSVEKRRIDDDKITRIPANSDFGGGETVDLKMRPGDAVIYQGVHHRHARLTPNPNRWSAHLFLGWVERDGPHKEHAFDGLALPPKADFFF